VGIPALRDPAAGELVEDGFQALCERIDVLPCLMDAAIFASDRCCVGCHPVPPTSFGIIIAGMPSSSTIIRP